MAKLAEKVPEEEQKDQDLRNILNYVNKDVIEKRKAEE